MGENASVEGFMGHLAGVLGQLHPRPLRYWQAVPLGFQPLWAW